MHEEILKNYFEGRVNITDLFDDAIGAKVKVGAKVKRGEGSINGKHSVVMTVQKQPNADTLVLEGAYADATHDTAAACGFYRQACQRQQSWACGKLRESCSP